MISGIGGFSKAWSVYGDGGASDAVDAVARWIDTVDIDVGDIDAGWCDGEIGAG